MAKARLILALAITICLGGCERTKPTPPPPAVVAANMRIQIPAAAQNVRCHQEAVFVYWGWVCFDVPPDVATEFLASHEHLTDDALLRRDAGVTDNFASIGGKPAWWNPESFTDIRVATAGGINSAGGRSTAWNSGVAVATLTDGDVRVFVYVTEEATSPQPAD